MKEISVMDGDKIIAVKFFNLDDATAKEAAAYVEAVKRKISEMPLESIEVRLCKDGKVDVSYLAKGEKFDRIRRITGYLVGTVDRWNDAKQAEESERVKHYGGSSEM